MLMKIRHWSADGAGSVFYYNTDDIEQVSASRNPGKTAIRFRNERSFIDDERPLSVFVRDFNQLLLTGKNPE